LAPKQLTDANLVIDLVLVKYNPDFGLEQLLPSPKAQRDSFQSTPDFQKELYHSKMGSG
jgi:hypothetical protein